MGAAEGRGRCSGMFVDSGTQRSMDSSYLTAEKTRLMVVQNAIGHDFAGLGNGTVEMAPKRRKAGSVLDLQSDQTWLG